MILLIDNYDSFSYNLFQLIGAIDPDIRVVRNDELTVEEVAALSPAAIVLSPGPGRPEDAGICEAVVRELGATIPILGVCLGHQAIVQAYGGVVGYARELMHGKVSPCRVDPESVLFAGLGQEVVVGRYHSLAAEPDTLPSTLRVTARTADGEVMAVEHTQHPVFGMQFHPESIMTPEGGAMVANFLAAARAFNAHNETSRERSDR
ncbi:anthranilate synthase component II [Anaerotardibacter muris]|uniref:anthranilate synthase component II n=1 Tax=Anaerotardibacter muris TaxID=2941505 RepID=UPI00203AFB1A|nr:aminodeoxychorismate/anthranilate synthase component II [Anaerotardibacter muris]